MTDDDDRYLITPLEGPPDPNAPHVTVDCSRTPCRMSFFVAKDDPRLPDGPFLCPDHDDRPTKFKMADLVQATVICDRCEAQLMAEGATREEAIAKLREKIIANHWKVVDRLDGPINIAIAPKSPASSTVLVPDLCGDCAAQR